MLSNLCGSVPCYHQLVRVVLYLIGNHQACSLLDKVESNHITLLRSSFAVVFQKMIQLP